MWWLQNQALAGRDQGSQFPPTQPLEQIKLQPSGLSPAGIEDDEPDTIMHDDELPG